MTMRIWFWPGLLAVLSGSGLLVGLVWDGAGDLFACLSLSLPLALSLWHGWLKR